MYIYKNKNRFFNNYKTYIIIAFIFKKKKHLIIIMLKLLRDTMEYSKWGSLKMKLDLST